MLFHFVLVSGFLLASASLADCRREHRFVNPAKQLTRRDSIYSDNWSGAVLAKENGTFHSATGTFAVPIPSGKDQSATTVWVGIDGYPCTGLLQTGVDLVVNDQDGPEYNAWVEWYPASAIFFPDLHISPGDVVRATVNASSPTAGSATVENLTNNQTAFQQVNSTYALCQQSAEWIVEDFMDNGTSPVYFANFDTVTFTNAVATGPAGSYTLDQGTTIINIEESGQVLTSVSIDGSSSSVTINYV